MKVFQIVNDICHYDATSQFPAIFYTIGKFPPDVLFVEAPDYVFEGWGYDSTKEGDDRFIQPTPPEGWVYNAETGTFYPEDYVAPEAAPTELEKLRADIDYLLMLEEG